MSTKHILIILIIAIAVLAVIYLAKPCASWHIDKTMKFQIAYLPTNINNKQPAKNLTKPKTLGLTKTYLPDIDNINLANFLNLGFQVPQPTHAEQYNLYLKLLHFPANFNAAKTSLPILDEFLLNTIKGGKQLTSYASSANNLTIKQIFIAKSNRKFSPKDSFPELAVNSDQAAFNQQIPFASLYVLPKAKHRLKNPDANAAWSTNGVKTIHKELITSYKKDLLEVVGNDNQHYSYFINAEAPGYPKQLTVLKIPHQIMTFNNWRDLPMPQDPQHDFLTGLLLVYHTVYTLAPNTAPPQTLPTIDSNQFNKLYIDPKITVLEVGSVTYTKTKKHLAANK
ncbi:MAG: hypothetical protein KAT71_05520 [Gammaproteobacteria bacterium]|nr:hypothetical protein [Gammaproteobacteria bacterium]